MLQKTFLTLLVPKIPPYLQLPEMASSRSILIRKLLPRKAKVARVEEGARSSLEGDSRRSEKGTKIYSVIFGHASDLDSCFLFVGYICLGIALQFCFVLCTTRFHVNKISYALVHDLCI